jgi:hypothetical protein
MWNYESNPMITNCIFSGNSARVGGAMENLYSNPAITNCTFTDNVARLGPPGGNGGAMSNRYGSPTVSNCTFTGNSAAKVGGAMRNTQSNLVITNCTFSGNSAEWYGGAMYNGYYSNPTITNCIFTSNSAEWYGGAMFDIDNSSSTVTNCIFSGNSASYFGGAMYNVDSSSTVTNCILWGNGPLGIYNYDSNAIITYSDVQGGWGGVGNIDEEPHFASDTDLHLMPDSPCIEAGDPNYAAGPNETDLDGNPRIAGARIDMGAYEYPAAPCIAVPSRRITFIKDRPDGLEKTLQIRNCGPGELKWKIIEDCPWLKVSPIKGVSSGQINEVTLTADANGLSVGKYRCQITITGSNAVNSPVAVDVILHIGSLLHVPGEYSTIQDAIDAASDWDTVLVADGVYKGIGNRDIDFRGRKIWLKSENGAEDCIIDCNASSAEPHRGFYFHSGEDADSIIDGLTVTNGYVYYDFGGGIYCKYSSPAITNCTFSGNSAYSGGAMFNSYGKSIISNCTFRGNSAEHGSGGAMFNDGHNPAIAITNCTFSGNSAKKDGGAMFNYISSPAITNCILWGNKPQEIYNYHSNAIITYSDVQGGWGGVGNIDINPLFVDPCNGDYHLFEDSPCIDAGDPNYIAGPNETDLDGNPRIVNGRIDMGAFELQPLSLAELLLDLTNYLDELGLHKGIASSLQSKLEAASQLLEDGNENNDGAAVNLLEAFINAIQAQYGKKIPAADADVLITVAQEIIELLSG